MKKKGKNMLNTEQIHKLWLLYNKLNKEQQKEFIDYVGAVDLATDINPELIRDAVMELIQRYPELKDIICF